MENYTSFFDMDWRIFVIRFSSPIPSEAIIINFI